MTELLPCPFCGKNSVSVGGLVPWVECELCGACGPPAAYEDQACEAWNTRAPAAPVVVGEDVYRRALVWLASGDTGSSSEAIVYHMLGLESDADYPFDPADLGRCLRMLELFPEWKPRISEMSAYPHGWPALIPIWNKIAAMMADEVGIDWSKGRRAPRTYAAMRAALTAALAGD